jgi:hypothetical protein
MNFQSCRNERVLSGLIIPEKPLIKEGVFIHV